MVSAKGQQLQASSEQKPVVHDVWVRCAQNAVCTDTLQTLTPPWCTDCGVWDMAVATVITAWLWEWPPDELCKRACPPGFWREGLPLILQCQAIRSPAIHGTPSSLWNHQQLRRKQLLTEGHWDTTGTQVLSLTAGGPREHICQGNTLTMWTSSWTKPNQIYIALRTHKSQMDIKTIRFYPFSSPSLIVVGLSSLEGTLVYERNRLQRKTPFTTCLYPSQR